ncbi:MAG: response regulator transcription factor [Bacteroidota bacterium]|nr:response regulator transcription factor [Bacteroidota bacterium]
MNIIIADDHQLILEGLATAISNHFKDARVTRAENKEVLFAKLKQCNYDILLQDIKFGLDDARDFIPEIKKCFPDLKIIVLSTISNSISIQQIINKGLSGYVLKSDSTQEIIEAIKSVYNGNKYLSKSVQRILNSTSLDTQIILTKREKEILNVIMQEKPIKEIAEKLFISEKTVEMHRRNLFIKLEVKNITGLIKKVIALGLMEE